MIKVQFFPLDIDYVVEDEEVFIRLFGRTKDNKKICVLDSNFKPYFLVNYKGNKKLVEKLEDLKIGDAVVLKTEIIKKNYLGREIEFLKVVVNHPKAISIVREFLKDYDVESKEYDIDYINRYLIDNEIIPLNLYEVEGEAVGSRLVVDYVIKAKKIKQLNSDVLEDPRILAFDIETYSGVESYALAERDPIIMVSFYGNDGFKKVVTYKKFKNAEDYIEFVESEEALIERFVEIVKRQSPDFLVGYFSDGFDLPYLVVRAKKYGIKLDIGLVDKEIRVVKRRGLSTVKIKGFVHLDLFKFISRIISDSLQTDVLDLNSVANELLGEGKIKTKVDDLMRHWENEKEIEKFCEYNLQDANITLKLCEKILPNLEELTRLVGQPPYDVCRMSYGQLVESYLMKMSKEFNVVIPNKPTYEKFRRLEATYKGAFVMEPKPGFYRNIVVFDFLSLYPSIIFAHNICPSTLTKDRKNSYESPEIESNGKKIRYYFSTAKEGFIPSVIKDLIIRRGRIKELLKKEKSPILEARSYALKTLANATYGMYGFFGARWYSKECAEAITAFGRYYIKSLIENAKKEFEVIYGDTDSVAIALGEKKKEDALSFLRNINISLPSLMELELEDFYPRGIFVAKKGETGGAKKKYVLISKDGVIKVRGFEAVRRNWSAIAKEVQNKVFEIVLKEDFPEKAVEYVKKVIEDVRKKKVNIEDMVIKMQLTKNLDSYEQIGPHVAVARKMKEKGISIRPGIIVRYVITEGKGMIRDRAKTLDECDDYDAEYYINNQIIPAVGTIFEVLGYTKEDLLSSEQRRLGDFK